MENEETPKRKKRTDQMFEQAKRLDNGMIICARCFEEKEHSKGNKNFCKQCYTWIVNIRAQQNYGKEKTNQMNKWNVRDIYCNTVIRHHEKEFQIGLKVDERTEKYLTTIGYGFIFKEHEVR
jgi:hypothetical protein